MHKFKILLVSVLALTLLSCGTTIATLTPLEDEYSNVTVDHAFGTCTSPDESHNINRQDFPMQAHLVRHKNCLGIDDALMIFWPGEPTERNLVGARLLMLMYVDFKNMKDFKTILRGKLVRVDTRSKGSELISGAFYSLETLTRVIPE